MSAQVSAPIPSMCELGGTPPKYLRTFFNETPFQRAVPMAPSAHGYKVVQVSKLAIQKHLVVQQTEAHHPPQGSKRSVRHVEFRSTAG